MTGGYFLFLGDSGFFTIGAAFLGAGFFSSFFGGGCGGGTFLRSIGTTSASSSSSRLSSDGALSEPELFPSSPIVIFMSYLFSESSFSSALAFN